MKNKAEKRTREEVCVGRPGAGEDATRMVLEGSLLVGLLTRDPHAVKPEPH